MSGHKCIFSSKHSLLGTSALLLCWCSKIFQGLVSRKSAREVPELQLQDRARLLPVWSSWPGLCKDTRASTKGSAPSQQKSQRKTGFCPISPAICLPFILTLSTPRAKGWTLYSLFDVKFSATWVTAGCGWWGFLQLETQRMHLFWNSLTG